MGKVRRALNDGKLSRSEARSLNANQLERAIDRVESSAGALTIGGGVQNYASNNQMPRIANRIAAINTGGSPGTGGSPSSGGSSGTGANTGSQNWQQDPILQFASGRDRSPEYNTLLSNAGMEGAFDGAAWSRAQAAGFSDEEIANAVGNYDPKSNLMIGTRVKQVIDNWQNENPYSYRAYANGYAQETSQPGTLTFNPLGVNIGLGTGGLQDVGVNWSSKQGYGDGEDYSQYQSTVADRANLLDSGYYQRTPEGFNRMMSGEAAQPYRYMGNEFGTPMSGGEYAYGYNQYNSPAAQQYLNNLNYQGSWMMPQSGVAASTGKKGKR